MDSGELLTRWTVRVALAFYVIALAVRLLARGQPAWLAVARLAWTAGYVMFLLHVAFAFEFYHHWSHDAAYQDTARQTEEVIGVAWGGGVYANYVFVVVWGFDALWWWARPQTYLARPRSIEWSIQGFLAFIAFNATVVFGSGAVRWLGLAACVMIALLVGLRYSGRKGRPSDGGSA